MRDQEIPNLWLSLVWDNNRVVMPYIPVKGKEGGGTANPPSRRVFPGFGVPSPLHQEPALVFPDASS